MRLNLLPTKKFKFKGTFNFLDWIELGVLIFLVLVLLILLSPLILESLNPGLRKERVRVFKEGCSNPKFIAANKYYYFYECQNGKVVKTEFAPDEVLND